MLGTEPNTLTSKKLASTLYILRPENKIIEELLTLPALFPLSAECRTEEKKFCTNLKKLVLILLRYQRKDQSSK